MVYSLVSNIFIITLIWLVWVACLFFMWLWSAQLISTRFWFRLFLIWYSRFFFVIVVWFFDLWSLFLLGLWNLFLFVAGRSGFSDFCLLGNSITRGCNVAFHILWFGNTFSSRCGIFVAQIFKERWSYSWWWRICNRYMCIIIRCGMWAWK